MESKLSTPCRVEGFGVKGRSPFGVFVGDTEARCKDYYCPKYSICKNWEYHAASKTCNMYDTSYGLTRKAGYTGGYAKRENCYNGPLKSCGRKKKGYMSDVSPIMQITGIANKFRMTAEDCEMNWCGMDPRCSFWEFSTNRKMCSIYPRGGGRFFSYRDSVAGSKDC